MCSSHSIPALYCLIDDTNHKPKCLDNFKSSLCTNIRFFSLSELYRLPLIQHPYFILIDYHLSFAQQQEPHSHPFILNALGSILINAPDHPCYSKVALWPKLVGYFSERLNSSQCNKQLSAILEGNYQLPTTLVVPLIHYLQSQNRTHTQENLKTQLSLTCREMEILRYLSIEQSNQDIAEALFVSEYTVKSHLYRIFRKIKVDNRRQAIHWANLHLN